MLKQKSGDQLNIADATYCYQSFCIIGPIYLQNTVCVEKIELAKAIGENRIKRINDNNFTVKVFRKTANGTKLYLQITADFRHVNVLTGNITCYPANICLLY